MVEVRVLSKRFLKITLWLIGLVVVGYIVLIGFFMFGPNIQNYATQTTFDSVRWKASLNKSDPIRQRMVSSLKANHALLGQTKEQIERLLGTPPATGYFKEYDYVYWLGPERSVFGIDSEWLCLKFENGKVIKAEILTD